MLFCGADFCFWQQADIPIVDANVGFQVECVAKLDALVLAGFPDSRRCSRRAEQSKGLGDDAAGYRNRSVWPVIRTRLGSSYRSGRSPYWVRVKKSESVRGRAGGRRGLWSLRQLHSGTNFPAAVFCLK
jgi:hypothetical protein